MPPRPRDPPTAPHAARARRRALAGIALAAPTLGILAVDLLARGDRILAFRWHGEGARSIAEGLRGAHALAYALSALGSAAFWGLLLLLAAASRGRRPLRTAAALAFLVLFTVALGVQTAFRDRWGTYLSRDGTELSEHPLWAAFGSLRLRPSLALFFGGAFAAALVLLLAARRHARPRRRARRIAIALFPIVAGAALVLPVSYRGRQSTTPDLIWLNAVARGVEGHRELVASGEASFQIRSPEPVPPFSPEPARPRNVLFILQESQRADVTCIAYDPACPLATRGTNEAAPARLPLENVRSNASVTAIAMGVLFTGLDPTSPRERFLRAPSLFDYAHAAGYDTAYFTSQHLMFANMWLWMQDVPSGHVVLGTHLDAEADMFTGADDAELTRRVILEWGALREPFFAVVHYSNIHAPRRAVAGDGPFRPASDHKSSREPYFNGYRNAVHRSDLAVAALLRFVRSTPAGSRAVVVYTSDHGEAMWEHGQGCDHGCSLHEEEIRVPAWIDAPEGTLSPEERARIASARHDYVFHLDVAPTLLDLLGAWDAPALAEPRRVLLGHPLTRAERTVGPVPLSNVSAIWERGLPSFGLMQGRFKLAAMHRDPGYACRDVEADPGEIGEATEGCEGLAARAASLYGGAPSGFDRLVHHPRWGGFAR